MLKRESLFLIIAVILALAGVGFVYFISPTKLSVAVGPTDSPDASLMRAYAQQLADQRTSLRLTIRNAADYRDAAQMLESERSDLAIVRTDIAMPANGLTMAIMRESAVMVFAPRSAKIADFGGLAGRRIGVMTEHEADPNLLSQLLQHYDLQAPGVTLVPLTRAAAIPALKARRIDAAALVASPTGPIASEFAAAFAKAYDNAVMLVPVSDGDAIVQRNPILTSVTVPAGVWGGRPKFPADEIKTVGVTYRLLARSKIDRNVVAEATQYLFQFRSRLAAATRAANLMRAPDNDGSTSATLPNHPGAVDYFEREQRSFMERYGDFVYLIALFGSGFVSALAWLRQRFIRRRRERIDDVLDRLLTIVKEARAAETALRLDELKIETEDLLAAAIDYTRAGTDDRRSHRVVTFSVDAARAAIVDRRRQLDQAAQAARRNEPPRLVATT